MTVCRLQRHLRCDTLYLHAPGRVLVEEGVDDLSQAGALDIAGPVSSSLVRDHSLKLTRTLGWTLTVDAFASKSNSLLPRFFARYAEPDAEAVDAFTVQDWARFLCPSCDHCHRETLFAFPPASLLNVFVAKARSDGARAIVVAPLAVAAPYWNKLLRSSVVQNDAGYLSIRRQQFSSDSDVTGELAVFAVDFAPYASRSLTTAYPPGCGMEARFRRRSLLGSPSDQAKRARIRAEILSVGLSLHQAHLPPRTSLLQP
jgi:hypothetical protein